MSSVQLTQAVTSGDAGAVSTVLANGADVNERTGGGQTPLILATIFGHTHLIPLLLEAGADPQLRDNLGLNAVDWAHRRGASEALGMLTNKPPRRSSIEARAETGTPVETRTRVDTRHTSTVRDAAPRERDTDNHRSVSQAEKSQRWLAGLKQRIAEQSQQITERSQRDVDEGPNIFTRQPEPAPEIPELPRPTPEIPELPTPQPEIPKPGPDVPELPKPELPGTPPEQPKPVSPIPPQPQPEIPAEPPVTEPRTTQPPVTEPPAAQTRRETAPTPPPSFTAPRATDPPVTEPRTTQPPMTEPPAAQARRETAPTPPQSFTAPRVTDPPVTEPPTTQPPMTEPPVTQTRREPAPTPPRSFTAPRVTDPPVTEPPATHTPVIAPATHAPVTGPPATHTATTEPPVTQLTQHTEDKPARPRSGRKRCPKCGAVYNSELLAYCAHHFVALVDADAPPVISEPTKTSPVMFWTIVIITLAGSLVVGSVITAFFYNTSRPEPQAASAPSTPTAIQKGTPVAGPELEGKIVSLPVAECPLNGQEAIPGTVVVRVIIDRSGQVKSATASGGDWLLRGAASEAALKSTFAPEKLRSRETEGTITYTFEP